MGQTVLVTATPDAPPWRMAVDLVQDGRITLALHDEPDAGDEPQPRRPSRAPSADWNRLTEVHLTCLGRFSVYLIQVAVVSCDATRIVVRPPANKGAVQRRAYVRVESRATSCTVLDPDTNTFTTFEAEVRDTPGAAVVRR